MKLNEYVCISDLARLSLSQIEAFSTYLKFLGYVNSEGFWERRPHARLNAAISILPTVYYGGAVLWTIVNDTNHHNRISYEDLLRMVAIGETMTHEC